MIHPDCFQRPWLLTQSEALRVRPENLQFLERCIHALELVGRLADGGLDFVFKGGTSLVLLLNPVRRLSIDVDIATAEPLERIKAVLEAATTNRSPFLRYEHQVERDRDAPPTKHFKLFFPSVVTPGRETYVLLDVLTTPAGYPATERRLVTAPFVQLAEESHVVLPTIDCLLGDKLAAFAPQTIGVLYAPKDRHGQPRDPDPLQIVKQLFDVGHLFVESTNLDHVDDAYQASFVTQNHYRGGGFSLEQCLDDTFDAARSLCLTPSDQAAAHTPEQKLLRRGQRGLATHLLSEPFTFDRHARIAASRAALLARLIKHRMVGEVPKNIAERMPSAAELGRIRLSELNVPIQAILRPTAPTALYYWSMIEDVAALRREA